MIVISGALILIALVLLILGVAVSIGFIYVAIALAVLSAGFLLYGVLTGGPVDDEDDRPARGRDSESDSKDAKKDAKAASKEGSKDEDTKDAPSSDVTVHPAPRSKDRDGSGDDKADDQRDGRGRQVAAGAAAAGAVGAAAAHGATDRGDDDEPQAGDYDQDELPEEDVPDGAVAAAQRADEAVFVVSGYPRFHARRCPAVGTDDDVEDIDLVEAIELGFTPCGVCRPLATLGGTKDGSDQQGPAQAATTPHEPADSAPAAHGATTAGDPPDEHREASRTWSSGGAWTGTAAAMGGSAAVGSSPASTNGSGSSGASQPAAAERDMTPDAAPETQQMSRSDLDRGLGTAEAEKEQAQPIAAPTGAVRAGSSRTSTRSRTVLADASGREYHREGCEAAGQDLEEMSKVAAIRKGYLACGVCRP